MRCPRPRRRPVRRLSVNRLRRPSSHRLVIRRKVRAIRPPRHNPRLHRRRSRPDREARASGRLPCEKTESYPVDSSPDRRDLLVTGQPAPARHELLVIRHAAVVVTDRDIPCSHDHSALTHGHALR